MGENKKYILMLIPTILILLVTLACSGCSSDEENKKIEAWHDAQMKSIPISRVDLKDISQIARIREYSTRYGVRTERTTKILLSFKYGDLDISKEYENNDVKIQKNLSSEEKPYISFKFVDTDRIYQTWNELDRIERGFYNIEVHLPKDYIIKEIKGGTTQE